MKLNYACVRDILISLEDHLVIDEAMTFLALRLNQINEFEELDGYSKQDILYSLINLKEAGFIDAHGVEADGNIVLDFIVYRITYHGHEFIETVRPKEVWTQTSNILSKLGSISLPLISSVAQSLLTSNIQSLISNH